MTTANTTIRVTADFAPFRRIIQSANLALHRNLADMGAIAPRLSVGVDIDDIIFGWYARAHEICEAAGITNGVIPTTWAPHEEYGCEHTAWIDALDEATQTGMLYEGDPLDDAVEQLWRLREQGHYVHLVTARGAWAHSELVMEHTRNWIATHEIPHDSLTFTKHKPDVPCDFFVDDHRRNYEELDAAGVEVYYITRTWNEDHAGARRVGSLKDFIDIVLEASAS